MGALTLGWSNTPRGKAALRNWAAKVVLSALRVRSKRLPLDKLGSVVVIAPHPDDESFGCGGTINRLQAIDANLHVVFLTDGSGSHPDHPVLTALELRNQRRSEAIAAGRALGLPQERISFLDMLDGTLSDTDRPIRGQRIAVIGALLSQLVPDSILLPCREDGSSEHNAAFGLVKEALETSNIDPDLYEFPVWALWNPLLLVKPLVACKQVWRVDIRGLNSAKGAALAEYGSQTKPQPPDLNSALPAGFASMFLGSDEFFLSH
jgi:LmbE family N-acetylglucosaminyl deacetylase